MGVKKCVERKPRSVIEPIARCVEVLGGRRFRAHEGRGFRGLREREERNIRELTRAPHRLPAADEGGLGILFENHRVEGSDVADVPHALMHEARTLLMRPVCGHDGLHILHRELSLNSDGVREGFLIAPGVRRRSGEHGQRSLRAVLVPVRGTALDRLIGAAERKIRKVAGMRRHVPLRLNRMLDQVGRHQNVAFRHIVQPPEREGIRHKNDFVVLHFSRNIPMAAKQHDLPGFVPVGHRIGSTLIPIAVLRLKRNGDLHGFPCGRGPLGENAPNAVANAALTNRLAALEGVVAVVRNDDDAFFVHEVVGIRAPGGMQRLHPEVAERAGRLRNLRRIGFKRHPFARRVIGGRHPVLRRHDAKIIVFVVTDENFPRRGCGLADDDRRTAAAGGSSSAGEDRFGMC